MMPLTTPLKSVIAAPPPGVKSIKQDRSVMAVTRFLDVSEPLMRQDHFDAIGINEFVAAADLSVGAFYSRFDDKDAFFAFISMVRLEEFVNRAIMARAIMAEPGQTLDACIRILVETVIGYARDYRGFMRSAIRRSRNENTWSRYGASGREVMNQFSLIMPYMPGAGEADCEARFLFGIQILFSLIAHATTNDPGPYKLDDDAIIHHARNLLGAYWGAV